MKRDKGGDAVTQLLLTTFRLNGSFLEAADALSTPSGLTAARWQVLGTLMWRDMTVSDVARNMGLSRQAVQRIANILASEKLIVFIDNPADKRAKIAAATEAGRAAISSLRERQHAWANAVAEGIGAEEIEQAIGVMRQVIEKLEQEG
jgi:DNA-binding MarR family transcriptional regulator